jgi:hypothetical protein
VAILAAFVYLVLIMVFLFISGHIKSLPREGRRGVLVMAAALPFYVVRMVYMMLGDFGNVRYSPAIGDWKMAVGLEFVMEIVIVALLMGTTILVQPVFGKHNRGADDDGEAVNNATKDELQA